MAQPYSLAGQQLLLDRPEVRLREMLLEPGQAVPPHRHSQITDVFYGLEGLAEVLVNGVATLLEPGGVLAVPPGAVHSLRHAGQGRARVLLVQAGGAYDFLSVEGGGAGGS